ncbi:hypothetical protein FH609_005320 [Streptomyces sp. 3MP-14]|uniref:Uncharacterized protein n=1 Tax=Streptomyces mimosae TaxID=2586635 RepID=A0A5N6ALL1_9ACTN|nr:MULTISPECIES: hypothetical protein [Streptomyces]KAB8169717.1 hypothetical protein FH607_003000 [Streptomyces mimosae]KAB8178465.1 hypothetical protein FH609_005320 [Streptomyces sp. 3MP-14]
MFASFETPEWFAQLPIGMTPEETYALAAERARAYAGGDADRERSYLNEVHACSLAMERAGAVYAGAVMGYLEDELSLAVLTVAVRELDYGPDTRVAAEGVLQSLVASRGPLWSGDVYPLPCGQPAAVVTGPRGFRSPGMEPSEVPFAELQAYVPVPEGSASTEQRMLIVTFSTPAAGHWERYMPLLVRLLRSLTFSESRTSMATELSTG